MEAELKRGGANGSRGVAPVLSGSVSDSLSVFTLSKSICHRNCGTKREGSLPGRTHSERNEEKTRQPQMGRSEGCRGAYSSTCLTSNYTATECAMRQ